MESQFRLIIKQVAQLEIQQGVMAMKTGVDVDAAAKRIAAGCALLAMLKANE